MAYNAGNVFPFDDVIVIMFPDIFSKVKAGLYELYLNWSVNADVLETLVHDFSVLIAKWSIFPWGRIFFI